ncbi:MAG: hypothetical protein IJC48_06135 [Clostridia bacterium]|nr:hypothetical protein [Clostridia bacterium]MBQ4159004.1 hypothetical protein [Clostridia bacterium]
MGEDNVLQELREKTEELKKVTGELEAKIEKMPYAEETANARAMMEKMVSELRRMEKNLQAMIRISTESESEGGQTNGNY